MAEEKKAPTKIELARSLGAVAPEKMDEKDLDALVSGLQAKAALAKAAVAKYGRLVKVTNTSDKHEMKMVEGKEYYFKAKETKKVGLLLATKFFGDKPFTVEK